MVASKKIPCVICNKKCSGNVLRYQDQYYHKQCFELEQMNNKRQQQQQHNQQQQQQHQTNHHHESMQQTKQQQATSTTTTTTTTTKSTNNNNNKTTPSTIPTSTSTPNIRQHHQQQQQQFTSCAGCNEKIKDGQALIALDLHWHVWCFKCTQCKKPLHAEYVAKDGKAYCEKDYQELFGVSCVYCKRYITGKVLQAGEAHHFHPSCARCSKCGDPFVPGEEMYLQGEVTWHPRCGPGPDQMTPSMMEEFGLVDATSRSQLRNSRAQSPSLSSPSRSRSASPFSFMSRQYGRSSPCYADSEAVGDLSRIYTISYLNADPTQGYLRRPIEPNPPKSPQFSRPTSSMRDTRSRSSSRLNYYTSASNSGLARDRSMPRGMSSVLSSLRGGGAGGGAGGSSLRARSPSMMNEEAIHLAQYPSGQKPSPDAVPKIERDDFPAPPFPYPDRVGGTSAASVTNQQPTHQANGVRNNEDPNYCRRSNQLDQQQQKLLRQPQQRASRPRSREINIADDIDLSCGDSSSATGDNDQPRFKKEEEELSKIASGIGKVFLQTLKEREKLRAWKRANLDPRNASRTPSATREIPTRLRYDNPTNASPSRDMDRPRPWDEEDGAAVGSAIGGGAGSDHSPTRARSPIGGRPSTMSASTAPSYGYKVVQSNRSTPKPGYGLGAISQPATLNNSNYAPHESSLAAYNNINNGTLAGHASEMSFSQQQRLAEHQSAELLSRANNHQQQQQQQTNQHQYLPSSTYYNNHRQHYHHHNTLGSSTLNGTSAGVGSNQPNYQSEFGATPNNRSGTIKSTASRQSAHSLNALHLRRSMPNLNSLHHLHREGPPKLYPYHLLSTSNYRLPPDVDRCHLERHLSNEEFQYIFHCDRIDFYRLPEWKRNELKRRAKLF